MGKNIEKVKKLIAGVGGKRTPGVGYTGKTIHMRKEGEIWEEASGRKFTKVDGKRQQITKIPPKGFDKCDDCEKLILKTIDQQTYNRFKKCNANSPFDETIAKAIGNHEQGLNKI